MYYLNKDAIIIHMYSYQLSLNKLAQKCNLNRQTLYKYLYEEDKPLTLYTLLKLIRGTNLTLSQLTVNEENKNNSQYLPKYDFKKIPKK